ncbi:MAG: hypothetical protein K6E30_09470 [Lachnospiraceae bacterium]|nr:hypothetical protein [Lachnospiraceae bacterium]
MAKYNCKTCGAELFFNPKTGKLECDYCGSSFDPSEYGGAREEEKGVGEPVKDPETGDDYVTDEKSTDDSIGDLVIYKCPHCGAEVITSKQTAATTCVYCNRAITMEGNLTGNFRPDYVLPFKKERKDVEAAYIQLCKKSFLTPRLFQQKSTIEKIKGMYIPFWLYTFDGEADLSVLGKNIRTWRSGSIEYTEISSYRVQEKAQGEFNNIPADALKGMDNTLMDSIEPFDFKELKKFNPAYLAGFYTQKWDEDAGKNEARAKKRARDSLQSAVMEHVGTYSGGTTIEHETYTWSNNQTHYAMLPVWMMYTEYKGKKYIFGMNGQTGKLMGDIPKDPGRIVEVGAGVFIISQLVMMLIRILGVIL